MNETIKEPAAEPQPADPSVEVVPAATKISITDQEKEKFFKCFVGDLPYSQVIQLFDGKFNITVRSLYVNERADVIKQIAMDQDKGVAKNDDQYFIRIGAYYLGLALVEINGEAYLPTVTAISTPDNKEAGSTYVLKKAEPLLKWPDFKLASVTDAFNEFERKVIELVKAIQTIDFWKAAV